MITVMKSVPVLFGVIAIATSYHVGSGASSAQPSPEYIFVNLRSLDVTNTRGNSINNNGWVAGYSSLAGNVARNAVGWFHGRRVNLGTLGGPNSSVAWPVKNDTGLIVGIAQTDDEDPSAATWSCASFFPGPDAQRYTCRGFAWEGGAMRALPTLGSGLNGYAAGANNRDEIVGWAENGVVDTVSCAAPRTIQFRPVIWGPGTEEIRELPLWAADDTSGAATAINDVGQAVGISGTCDQAVGRHTARHAVIWENGTVDNIGTLGGNTWNTPTAINRHGVVVGFASQAGDPPNSPRLRAFVWTRSEGIRDLGTLPDHATALALGINDKGQIVGTSCPVQGACRAFLYENGVMRDLNAFTVPGYAFHLTRAQDINNDGAITGSAVVPPITTSSQTQAFLAIPTGLRAGVHEDPAHPMAPRRHALR